MSTIELSDRDLYVALRNRDEREPQAPRSPLMGARTGKQFLEGLRKPRNIWVGGDRVDDVVSHPAFAGAAQTMAEIFDLQHEAASVCLTPDRETGEPINVSHLVPRSRQDLELRHHGLKHTAEYTVGLTGSGETVNTSSIGEPSADGTMRRVSIRRPFASRRN